RGGFRLHRRTYQARARHRPVNEARASALSMSPLSALLWMVAAAAAFAYWNAARAAAERAGVLGRNACKAAGVIWLDQSVHAAGLRVCRGEDGWLGFERSFRFEYSH